MNPAQSARFERYSENCPDCGGLGIVTRYYGGGCFVSDIDCERCRGRGRVGNCKRCRGTGFEQDAGVEGACPDCHGLGAVGDCPRCAGTGVDALTGEADCPACGGLGFC